MNILSNHRVIFTLVLVLDCIIHQANSLEPITTGVATAFAGVTSVFFAGYTVFKCKFFECCDAPWFSPNITGLKHDLEAKLHGQHVVIDAVFKSILGHVRYPAPEKALVLSFHGTTGSGKNFVSRIIADNLYQKGMDSNFVHFFHDGHFPHESKLAEYQDMLRQNISEAGRACERNLFIFDEMDKIPGGVINAIKPFLDHYPQINGVDYRKNIFIFLSNTGGREIINYTLSQWVAGRDREEIQYRELEQILTRRAFNEQGGLWHSTLIDHSLISAFIPFLPMERQHVKKCIEDDLRSKKITSKPSLVDKIADEMTYVPHDLKLYSQTGCKRVSEKVNLYAEYSSHEEL